MRKRSAVMRRLVLVLVGGAALALASCGSGPEATRDATPTVVIPDTKEGLYNLGHVFYLRQQYDSAEVFLKQSLAIDSTYMEPLTTLAQLHYEYASRIEGEKNPKKLEQVRKAVGYFKRIEALGNADSDVYERLCEMSVVLDDDRTFLRYAKRNVEKYPYDRQYYNLGLAYMNMNDYQSVIRTQREATEKFRTSPYIGGFYRQLGRAFMRVDRDQTAERTFDSGLRAVDGRIAELRKENSDYKDSPAYKRLVDDKVAMLLFLKKLHTTYRANDKLEKVERQLKALGYQE